MARVYFWGVLCAAWMVVSPLAGAQQAQRPSEWRNATGASGAQAVSEAPPADALPPGMASFSPARAPGMRPLASVQIAWTPGESLIQHRLLNTALQGLAPQRPGKVDVYVLAVAMWGDNVFESEASGAAEVLSRKYAAQGRTLVLSNGGGTVANRFPAATPSFFTAALARIGEVMNPEEDLLILFLTSHGNPKDGVGFQVKDRLMANMMPEHLRDALLLSGVKNRVVIVSACFSGVFIGPLTDDRTIVLTAAIADRTSFGCQPERDWTYFGDAFINRSLRAGLGLLPAFDQARQTIAAWEARDKLPASSPQVYAGVRARAMIEALER